MDLQVRNVKFLGLNVCIGCCFSKFNLWSHLGREAAEIQVITLNDMEILSNYIIQGHRTHPPRQDFQIPESYYAFNFAGLAVSVPYE